MPATKNAETPVPLAQAKPEAVAAAGAKPASNRPAAAKAAPRKAPAAKPAVAKAAAATPAPAKSAAPKLSKLEETKARNKKALAEALAMAQAVQIAQPPKAPAPASAKASKPVKARKPKLVRHAFSMPDVEYAQLATLKKRIAALGGNVKRSELVRAGIALLAVLGDVELTAVMAKVERIKTGRPAK